jgi:hypothetical protein
MNLIMKCARVLVLLMPGLWLAIPAFADDGDSALTRCDFPPPIFNGPFHVRILAMTRFSLRTI